LTASEAQQQLRESGPKIVEPELRRSLDGLDDEPDSLGDDVFQVRLDVDHWRRAADAMLANSLQPYSIHLASAMYANCGDILSFDRGFGRVTTLNLWWVS
jgi:predicted nucleic acid-binding protein